MCGISFLWVAGFPGLDDCASIGNAEPIVCRSVHSVVISPLLPERRACARSTRPALGRFVLETLPHVDGAALLEVNFVHQCSHEINTSAMVGLDILDNPRKRDGLVVAVSSACIGVSPASTNNLSSSCRLKPGYVYEIVISVPARRRTPIICARWTSSSIFAYSRFLIAMYSGVRYFVSMPFSGVHHCNSSAETYCILGSGLKHKYFFFSDQENRFAPGRNRHRIGDCLFAAFRCSARFQSLHGREMDLCNAMELWRSLWRAKYLARDNPGFAGQLLDGHGHMFVQIYALEGFDVFGTRIDYD